VQPQQRPPGCPKDCYVVVNADQPTTAPVRVPHPALSLWQSCVRHVVATHVAEGDINNPDVARHRLVTDADDYVRQRRAYGYATVPRAVETVSGTENPFEIALAHAHNLVIKLGAFAEAVGHFSNLDPLFVECVFEFVKFYWLANRQPHYRDWKGLSKDVSFGVVADPIPSSARVAIIGDWGTGMPDAELLLEALLATEKPDVLIHLGDVYYSGTPAEFQHNFASVLNTAVLKLGKAPRVYAIPGNHDYYAGGGAFYDLIDTLNTETTRQTASYFCLRTEDEKVQFLGMDTGFNDRAPGVAFDRGYKAPMPHDSEIEWIKDKLANFKGKTILLSHHQAFSAHSAINGPDSGEPQDRNQQLLNSLDLDLGRVIAWLWGHEHNLVLFEDGQLGVAKGRLVGCSAFETTPGDDPYQINFPAIRVQPPRLQRSGNWFNHGCALVDLGKNQIAYLQMAAWTEGMPVPRPTLTEMTHEAFDVG